MVCSCCQHWDWWKMGCIELCGDDHIRYLCLSRCRAVWTHHMSWIMLSSWWITYLKLVNDYFISAFSDIRVSVISWNVCTVDKSGRVLHYFILETHRTLWLSVNFWLSSATESLMSGGGSSRRGSYDTEYSDDSGDSRQNTPKARSFKLSSSTPPKKKDLASKTFSCYLSILPYDYVHLEDVTIAYSFTSLNGEVTITRKKL